MVEAVYYKKKKKKKKKKTTKQMRLKSLVRCVALTKLVYGEGHLKLAQAHARLAKAYLQFKGNFKKVMLGENADCIYVFLKTNQLLFLVMLWKITLIFVSLYLTIWFFLCSFLFHRVYQRQGRSEEALGQCEKSLHLLEGKPEETCSVYKDMAAIEQNQGHLDKAIDTVLFVCFSHVVVDSAGPYFEQSLTAYKNSVGPQDPAFLTVQDDFCRFLLLNGQQERCVEIQRSSLALKRLTFGDLSAEVADTLQLIGSVEMSQGRIKQAHRTMRKVVTIYLQQIPCYDYAKCWLQTMNVNWKYYYMKIEHYPSAHQTDQNTPIKGGFCTLVMTCL
uniref:Tetratricopeptide repeat domain 23 n=1 Tax=Myripristis murdjan TaxID=586833 RepID=A0A667Z331_9TELE